MNQEDRLLIDRIARGDERAFRIFFDAHYPQVQGFAASMVKNKADADDIAQNVFIHLWLRRDLLADVRNIDAYLYRTTAHLVLKFIHRKSLPLQDVDLSSGHYDGSTEVTPQEDLEAQDLRLLTELVVRQMPAQRRKVYRLSREQGLSNDEIAQQLHIQKKTVENHLNIALGELRRVLKCFILLMFWW